MAPAVFDTPEAIQELARLAAEGKTQAEIAAALGYHPNTIAKYMHKLNYRGPAPARAASKYEHIINEKTSPGMMYADYLRNAGLSLKRTKYTDADWRASLDDEDDLEASKLRQKNWNKGLFDKKRPVDNQGNTLKEGV